MKIGGLSAIRVRAYVRKRQKEKEMRFAVRGGAASQRVRGGFSSDQPHKT